VWFPQNPGPVSSAGPGEEKNMTTWRCDQCGLHVTDDLVSDDPDIAPIQIGGVRVDPNLNHLTVDGERRHITYSRLMVLHTLMAARGRIVQMWRLREIVAETAIHSGREETLDRDIMSVHIFHIRKAILPHRDLIQNIWGRGYRYAVEDVGGSA
jgi:DNA-binding response OmpR family regulator